MSLEVFGKKLSIMILVFCGLLFAINVFRGEKISSAFMFAVALAVAAIPEALSSIVTIVLSFGTQKMAKEHAIIRKLQAVEGLGSVKLYCDNCSFFRNTEDGKGAQQLQLMWQIWHKDVFWITVFYVMIQQMKMEWRSEIRRKQH